MDTQNFLDIILENTFTKADVIRRLRVLRMILEHTLFSPNPNAKQYIESLHVAASDVDIVNIWIAKTTLKFSQDNLYKALKKISDDVDKIPNIIFYIASEIKDPTYLEKITTWVRTYIEPKALLELKVDPKKVGGLAFVQKGILQDYSLEYFMKQKRKDILDMVGTYAS